ncbi:MAG: hypothetical protein HC867_10155 [Bacteroidia bacterium]|nr:hypothetical protein [Bacteroidia bacterium]
MTVIQDPGRMKKEKGSASPLRKRKLTNPPFLIKTKKIQETDSIVPQTEEAWVVRGAETAIVK